MLSTIKNLLKTTATNQGLNFAFVSWKEVNKAMEDFDLNTPTIIVNSTITSKQEKTQGNVFKQIYKVHIGCVKKREVENDDEIVFDDVITSVESPFLTYLNTVGESLDLIIDLGNINIDTLYFPSGTPTAGVQAIVNLTTVCNLL